MLFAITGLAAYLITLIALLPARLLLDRVQREDIWLAASGTVWNGEAALAHGHAVRWRWAPLASLSTFTFTTALEITGADTELTGTASWRPGGIEITNLEGEASATLLAALEPDLPLLCDLPMRVMLDRIALGTERPGVAGEVRTSPGTCTARNAAPSVSSVVPALVAEATINVGGSNGWLAPQADRSVKLLSFTVAPNGGTSIDILPPGAALLPGARSTRF